MIFLDAHTHCGTASGRPQADYGRSAGQVLRTTTPEVRKLER